VESIKHHLGEGILTPRYPGIGLLDGDGAILAMIGLSSPDSEELQPLTDAPGNAIGALIAVVDRDDGEQGLPCIADRSDRIGILLGHGETYATNPQPGQDEPVLLIGILEADIGMPVLDEDVIDRIEHRPGRLEFHIGCSCSTSRS
jgi:hypothetical protein